jgi:2-hydroxy-3-oxopropionate reductase
MKIGFIGLGIMGKPMSKNLIKAGYELIVSDFNKGAVEELKALGAEIGSNPKEIAERSDIVITMLPNSPNVKAVALGENGLIEGAHEGLVYIDMSSISPGVSREVYHALAEKGVDMLDAPVSGGEPKAIDGTMSVMVGGKVEVFEKCKAVLDVMAGSVVLVGGIGAGNITKLANQVIVALNIAAVSEAFVLSQKAGVEPAAVFEAIRGGLAGSTVLEAKGPMMLNRNFDPGFRINLHMKDLTNALETSHEFGVPLPLTSSVLEMMYALKVDGHEFEDHSSLVKFYEKLANVEVSR